MNERCDSRFNEDGSTLLCIKPKGHDSSHEYGDWEWWDEESMPAPQSNAEVATQPMGSHTEEK